MRSGPILAMMLAAALMTGCETEVEEGDTIELSAVIKQATLQNDPWEGVEGCVADTDNCATSDSDGLLALDVAASSDVELVLTGDADFYPHVIGFGTGDSDDEFALNAALESNFKLQMDRVDVVLDTEIDRDKGFLLLNARNARGDMDADVAGVTATISPDSGTQVLYSDEMGLISDDTQTSSHGQVAVFELPIGSYTLTLSHATRTCTAWVSWPGDADNQVRVPIREGHVTQASAACPE